MSFVGTRLVLVSCYVCCWVAIGFSWLHCVCMSFSRFFAYSLVLPEWMWGHWVMEQFLWTSGFIAIASHGSEACIVAWWVLVLLSVY